jgi:hypothetical protein
MSSILANWKTSLTALVILVIAGLHTFLGLNIPGALDFGAALTVAVGLFVAGDAALTPKA